MYKVYLILICISFIIGCSSTKSAIDTAKGLDINDVSIGKSSAAVIGVINKVEQEDEKVNVSLTVQSSKQGGATAPAFGKNSNIDVVFTPLFQKNYQNQKSTSVLDVLKNGKTILIAVNRNLRTKEIEVIQLKTQK
ncbi:MAG: hypothetical protein ACJA2S_000353 [Cyclobacteriaceae bacterium]|jgi:hypothetical protein